MCGLWGWFGGRPNFVIINEAAKAAARRGPDSWGCVQFDEDGLELRSDRSMGRFARTPMLIGHSGVGHCRLATMGGTDVIQPLKVATMTIAHNGNFKERPTELEAFKAKTDCDTEILAMRLLLSANKDFRHTLIELTTTPSAVILNTQSAWLAISLGQPLYSEVVKGVHYVSSGSFGDSQPLDVLENRR